jgi:hypothetical protein
LPARHTPKTLNPYRFSGSTRHGAGAPRGGAISGLSCRNEGRRSWAIRRSGGALPGTTTFKERAQRHIAALERNWLIKTVAILAALAGAIISFLQLFRLLRE